MISARAQEYLASLCFDPQADRKRCLVPLGGVYWSDEIPDFLALVQMPKDERQFIYRLFSIRFRLWSEEPLSTDDDIFWCYCEKEYPECPILRRTALSPEDRKAQDECEAEIAEGFEMLFSGADDVEVEEGPHGSQIFSATFDLAKEDSSTPFWKRLWRRWTR